MKRVTITKSHDRTRYVFVADAESNERMDVGFSLCGYLAIHKGTTCIYKEDLKEIRSVYVETERGAFTIYKRGGW